MTDANISEGRFKTETPDKRIDTKFLPVETVDIANPKILEEASAKQKEKEDVATTQIDLIRSGIPTVSRVTPTDKKERNIVKDIFLDDSKKYYNVVDDYGVMLSVSPLTTGDTQKDELNRLSNNPKLDKNVEVKIPIKNPDGVSDTYTYYWDVGQVWNKEKGVFERTGRTEEEINQGAKKIVENAYVRQFVKDIANPYFFSTAQNGLKFKELGANIEAEVNDFNTVKGYGGDVGIELAKRDAFKKYAGELVDFAVGNGLAPIVGNGIFNIFKEAAEFSYGRSRYFENKEEFDSIIETAYAFKEDAVDALTVGDSWAATAQNLYARDEKELAEGIVARTPENWEAFLNGDNDYFLIRGGQTLVQTANINRATVKAMDFLGVGPKDAKKFFDELAGIKTVVEKKRQPYLKKTGFDYYKEEKIANAKATKKLVPSDAKLRKEYNNMANSTRSHYVNKALGTYLQTKLGIDGGGSFFKNTNMLLTQNKFDVGGNLRAYYKGENIFTISESAGYSISSEILTDNPLINTIVALGSGMGALKYTGTDYARRTRDPRQNVIQKGIKTVLNTVAEGSPYTLLDGLLYMIDPISRNFTFLKSRGIGTGEGIKELEFRGRVQKLKNIDKASNVKLRSDQYYADKALAEYGVEMPDKGTNLNYFLMVAGAAKSTGDVEKLITENKKEFKFLEDLAQGINKVQDPVIRTRVLESLQDFKKLQTEITRLKSTMKVDLAPGEVHPADQLSTALFNILPLYTTASAVRTMVQNAQAGYMRMINLSEAELLFQNAQTQFLAASKLMQDIVDRTRGGEIGESIQNTVSNVQQFMVEEGKIVQTARDELNDLVKVIEKFSNVDTYTKGETPLNFLETHLAQRADELSMNEIINGSGEIGDSIEAIQEARNRLQRKTISLLNNLASDYDTRGIKSRQVIYEQIMNDKSYDLILDGNIIYGSVYRKLKGVNVQGEDVDSLILNFRSLNKIEGSSDYYTKNINYNIKAKALRSLNTSLKPYGTQLRDRLKTLAEGDLDQVQETIQELGFEGNIYNEADLYEFYVSNVKNLEEGDPFLDIFKDVYDDYALSAETLVHMDRAVSNRKFILNKKETRSPEQDVELQNINSLRENIMNIFQTKKNIPADILNEFPLAKERYKNYVGIPKHDTIFTPKVERVDYTQNEDEMIETYDMIRDMKVKKKTVVDEKFTEKRYKKGKSPNDIQYEIGRILSSGNPSDIDYVYQQTLLRFGTEAEGTTKVLDSTGKEIPERTRVIANAVDADRANVILNQSVQTYVEKELQKAMKNYNPESDKELPQAAQNIIKSILPGGALHKSMRALEKKSIIKDGFKVWSRKLDGNGNPVMDNSGAWLNSRQSGVLSRVEYNKNKPVINFGATERKLEIPLRSIYKDNKEALKLVDEAEKTINKVLQRVGTSVKQKIQNDKVHYEGMTKFFQELKFGDQADVDPDILSEALLKDRTGANIKRLKEFLKEEAKNKKYYKITRQRERVIKTVMSKAEAEEEINRFVDDLVLRQLAKKVLVSADEISGNAPKFRVDRTTSQKVQDFFYVNPRSKREFFAMGEGGKSFIEEVNKVPDLTKLLETDSEFGQIFRTVLPDDQYDKVYAIAKKLSYDRKLLDEAAGVLGNAPTPISIAMVLQRAFNLARGMVSIQWVGADAMVRAARLGNADIMRAVLTTRVPVQTGSEFQVTAVDVLHDILVNGNHSKKNALQFRNVFPQMLENAQVTFETEEGPNAQSYSDEIGKIIEAVTPIEDLSRLPNVNVFQPFVPRIKSRKPRTIDDRPEIELQMEDVGLGRDRTIPTGRVKRKEPPKQESFLDPTPTGAATRRKEGRNKQRLKADSVTTADILQDINI